MYRVRAITYKENPSIGIERTSFLENGQAVFVMIKGLGVSGICI